MGKNPSAPFYWNDYYRDTRPLSRAVRGDWMDILCQLHFSLSRGALTLSLDAWGQVVGIPGDQFETSTLLELRQARVCKIVTHSDGRVTLQSRRMMREEKDRKNNALRQQRFRNNGRVTD